jgi:hypothetical protein
MEELGIISKVLGNVALPVALLVYGIVFMFKYFSKREREWHEKEKYWIDRMDKIEEKHEKKIQQLQSSLSEMIYNAGKLIKSSGNGNGKRED